MDPFAVLGPAMVSFSGGRTSAYMTYRILQAHGGHLPSNVHVVFSNTGKERKETLDFVQKCADTWKIQIRWIEAIFEKPFFREVDFASASRAGEPFAALLDKKKALPNAVARFCTQELKIIPMARWMRAQGYDEWTVLVGLRYDEPSRVARIRAPSKERFFREAPLYQAKVTKAEVMQFWSKQPFDLKLQPHESNCDLCFLKGSKKRLEILRKQPSLADWWIEQEQRIGATFVSPSREPGGYQSLKKIVHYLPLLPNLGLDEEHLIDCVCTDLGWTYALDFASIENMRTAMVLPNDTLGSFCQRHGVSREEIFFFNQHLERIFTPEGVPTAFLEEGEELVFAGVGAAYGAKCAVNEGNGGWQMKDGRWYYAHHEGLTLHSLAQKYGTEVMTIWRGSKNAKTIPSSWQNPGAAPVFHNGERTLFWMPDNAIEKAYKDGCIPSKGELGGPKPLIASTGLTVPCRLNDGQGGWQKGEDGRWYFGHGPNILLGDLAEVYLGSVSAYQQIFNGSNERGLLPPGSTPDKVPIRWADGRQTMFWMPDEGILKAHNLGCIHDPGNLSKPPPIPCTDGAKSTWNLALGKWECPSPCAGGRIRASDGLTCICPEGTVAQNPSDSQSPCKPKGSSSSCPAGSVLQPDGSCAPKNPCPAGMKRNKSGECVAIACPPDHFLDESGQCRANQENPSQEDEEEKSSIWPWVLGGLALLGLGGALIYAASSKEDLPKDESISDAEDSEGSMNQDEPSSGMENFGERMR